jgi:hypothetical protein
LIRKLIAALVLAVGVIYLAFVFGSAEAARRDFISYWAAGQLLRAGENPYGFAETLRVERLAGFESFEPLIQRMPPVSLPLLLPLGFVDARSGAIVWSLLIILLLVFALHSARQWGNGSTRRLHLLGYFFAPALACILAGQSGVILLAGVVLFLRFHSSRPFVAGLSLALLSLKPHLFLVFATALLVWIVLNRRYAVLRGALTGLAALSLASAWIAPHAWPQYLAMIRAARVDELALPNVSLLFRVAINRDAVWLQCFPALAAIVWALWYARRTGGWDWTTHGALVLLVSVLVAPYSWFTDEAVLLPAMIHALYSADRQGRSLTWYIAPAGLATMLVLSGVPLYSMYYVWTPLAWLACWLKLEAARPSVKWPSAGQRPLSEPAIRPLL